MKFDHDHYVPVLKLKRGEKRALESLTPRVASRITPVLEVVENKDGVPPEIHLDKAFKDLEPSTKSLSAYFLDTREIRSAGSSAAEQAFTRARNLGKPFVPVTGINRTSDVAPAVAAGKKSGIAVRLRRKECEAGQIQEGLPDFITKNGISVASTDLLLDLGDVEELIPSGISRLSEAFLASIPDLGRWRTVTLIGCAFPFSLKDIARYSFAEEPRSEWMNWRDSLYQRRQSISRLPTFGDCAIQHPRGVEGFDPRFMPIPATVRYALEDSWLLLKGESNRTTPLVEQFPRLAAELTMGTHRRKFSGKDHCPGCKSMLQCAHGASGLGSPEAWRRLCTIHHITKTVEQLAALKRP